MSKLRGLLLASVSVAALMAPSAAHADPVFTPIIIAAAVAGAQYGVVAAIAVAALGLASAFLLQPKPPKPPTPADGQIIIKQPVPEVTYGMGERTRPGPQLAFQEAMNGFLYTIVALKDGLFQPEHWYLNDDEVELNPDGTVNRTSGAYRNGTVKFYWHDGGPCEPGDPNPFQEVIDAFPGVLSDDFRPDGIAAIGIRCYPVQQKDYNGVYPNGAPEPGAAGLMEPVYDWRDPGQKLGDPSTWEPSGNPVVWAAHYACHHPHGPGKDFERTILRRVEIWTEEADICDEEVPQAAGGTAPRYRLGYWFRSTTDRASIWETIRLSCDGWEWPFADGSFVFRVGKYRPPAETLTDDDIVEFTSDMGARASDYANSITPKYTSPAHDYGEVSLQPWQDDAAIVEHGLAATTLQLWPVQNQSQAMRLTKRAYDKGDSRAQGKLSCRLSALRCDGDRWVRITSSRMPGMANAVVEISDPSTSLMELRRSMSYRVINDNEIDSWEAAWEGPPPPAKERPDAGSTPEPATVVALAQAELLSDNTIGVRLSISWDEEPDRTDLEFMVRYRQDGSDGWIEQPVSEPRIAAGRVYVTTGFVVAGTSYDVQVRARGASGLTDWSPVVPVSTSMASVAPGQPTNPGASGGVGAATVTWRNPLTTNFATASVYRAPTGTPIGSATLVQSGIVGAAGANMSLNVPGLSAATYDFWIRAANGAGTLSTPAGPVTAIVT